MLWRHQYSLGVAWTAGAIAERERWRGMGNTMFIVNVGVCQRTATPPRCSGSSVGPVCVARVIEVAHTLDTTARPNVGVAIRCGESRVCGSSVAAPRPHQMLVSTPSDATACIPPHRVQALCGRCAEV